MFFERIWGSSQWNRKGCRTMNMRMMLTVIGLMAVWGAEGKLAPPKIEDYTYVCQKCRTRDALPCVCRIALAEEFLDRIYRIDRIKKGE